MRLGSLAAAFLTILLAASDRATGGSAGEELQKRIRVTDVVFEDGQGLRFRNALSLFWDPSARELLVCDAGNQRIVIFDDQLTARHTFSYSIVSQQLGQLVSGEPRELVVNDRGEIIVVDNLSNDLIVLDYAGVALMTVDLPRVLRDTTLQIKPLSIDIDADGFCYIVVTGDLTGVMVIDNQFELVRTFGRRGGGKADFQSPLAIVEHLGRLYVTDVHAEPAVKVFDHDGNYLHGFSSHGELREDVTFPGGIELYEGISGDRSVWIVDGLRQAVVVTTEAGEYITTVGGFGYNYGQFRYPADIAVTADSNFFVLEKVGQRIQRFRITD